MTWLLFQARFLVTFYERTCESTCFPTGFYLAGASFSSSYGLRVTFTTRVLAKRAFAAAIGTFAASAFAAAAFC